MQNVSDMFTVHLTLFDFRMAFLLLSNILNFIAFNTVSEFIIGF